MTEPLTPAIAEHDVKVRPGGGVITPRLGSLFTGAAGLDLAVETVLGTQTAWMCETDPAAARVLAHRFPDVPNLGDVTAVDWAQVEPVDVICGGSPCQDVSHAGKRAGMRAGTRSGLWAAMCDAIEALRPSLVVWENVRGVLSAEADSALEPCAGCVGDGDDGAVLRALGRVLGDLAGLRYDARWCGLRAADVGAPHGRFRVFIVASDASCVEGGVGDGDAVRAGWGAVGRGPSTGPRAAADASNAGHERGRRTRAGRDGSADGSRPTSTDAASDGRDEGRTESAGIVGGSDAAVSSATTPDTIGGGRGGWAPDSRRCSLGGAASHATGHAWRVGDGDRRTAPDADSSGGEARSGRPRSGDAGRLQSVERGGTDWGQYRPAIRRWEQRLGRVAPAPTEAGAKGGQRLSPAFVEWLMGWPAGWVSDVPGITRNDALRICGNGVVPQQAAEALRRLLTIEACAA